ncbi:MAG: UDP-glucose/GDP-mannose dehydrogenase family protein [bacterium]|nr:UDP-glucose/GDP-mannose dehydrogenase family protein [bacterium]
MTLTIIGHGYVGLVTACVFADFGNKVFVLGHTQEKIDRLKSGDTIIYEPGLEEVLKRNLGAGRIKFTLDYEECIPYSDVIFIAVGTPMSSTGKADLGAVYDVTKKIAKSLKNGYTVICCKSTVPVGTNKKIRDFLKKNITNDKSRFDVTSCPEFLREGSAVNDTFSPDRIVIGSNSERAKNLLLDLHKPVKGERIVTNIESAELIKYASNAMLATKISFANLFADLAERSGADVESILTAVGLDKRIGRSFLYPGIGFGGSCLPKDVNALIHISQELKVDSSLFKAITKINEDARNRFIVKIEKTIKAGSKLCLWGLSFKPNTDDLREAPSIYIIKNLIEKGYKLNAFDPVANNGIKKIFKEKLNLFDDQYETLKDCDALCILTEWNQFIEADFNKIKQNLKKPIIFDGRNIFSPEKIKQLGFKYYSVGR